METGLFAIMLILGFAFTFFAFREGVGKMGGLLHIIALALFVGMALFMSVGTEVSTTTSGGNELHYNGTGALIENVTKADTQNVFLSGGTDSFWLSFVFMGFAIMNLMMFIRDIYTT